MKIPEDYKKPLIRQILQGEIHPDQFPELWPDHKNMTPKERDLRISELKKKLFEDDHHHGSK